MDNFAYFRLKDNSSGVSDFLKDFNGIELISWWSDYNYFRIDNSLLRKIKLEKLKGDFSDIGKIILDKKLVEFVSLEYLVDNGLISTGSGGTTGSNGTTGQTYIHSPISGIGCLTGSSGVYGTSGSYNVAIGNKAGNFFKRRRTRQKVIY